MRKQKFWWGKFWILFLVSAYWLRGSLSLCSLPLVLLCFFIQILMSWLLMCILSGTICLFHGDLGKKKLSSWERIARGKRRQRMLAWRPDSTGWPFDMEAKARDYHRNNEGDPLPSHRGEPMHNPPRSEQRKHPFGWQAGGHFDQSHVAFLSVSPCRSWCILLWAVMHFDIVSHHESRLQCLTPRIVMHIYKSSNVNSNH